MGFVILFVLVSAISTCFQFSLIENKVVRMIALVFPSVLVLASFAWAKQQTNQSLQLLMNQPDVVALVAMAQIFAAIIALFLFFTQTQFYYQNNANKLIQKFWYGLLALPSPIFIVGLFFVQVTIFLKVESMDFFLLSTSLASTIFILLVVFVWLLSLLFRTWNIRAEVKSYIHLFQILLAMFLPLAIQGLKIPFSQLTIEFMPLIITTSIVLIGSLVGFLLQQFNINLKKSFLLLIAKF